MVTESETNRQTAFASRLAGLGKLMRPHQWIKNLLVLLPALLAQKLMVSGVWQEVLLAFVSLSLCASAVYVLNDRMDYLADRKHPKKQNRAFASGLVPLSWAPLAVGLFAAAGLLIAWQLTPPSFLYCLIFYLTVTSCYTFWLKRLVIIDVLVLGGLYTLRIIMGGLATDTAVSAWLLAFSVFIFSSIAFGKRYSELLRYQRIDADQKQSLQRRGYEVNDLSLVQTLGITTGMMSILVLALYLDSESAGKYYVYPQALWGVCVAVFYWICNFWLITHRGRMDEDVVKYILLDCSSWISGVIVIACTIIAVWPFG